MPPVNATAIIGPMSLERWRRALLARSGLSYTLQREWRRDNDRVAAGLKRLGGELATLQKSIDGLNEKLRALSTQARQQDKRLNEQSAAVDRLVNDARRAESEAAQLRADVTRAHLALTINAQHRERQHAGALEEAHVAEHVHRRMAASTVDADPMPHLLIEQLLPDDTYAALLSAIPPPEFFSQRDPVKRNFKVGQRQLAPEWTLQAWTFFEDVVIARVLLPALVARFQQWLPEGALYRASAGRLMLRGPGYHLDPHLDPEPVVFTTLVYFARPGDDESFGTQLFRIDKPIDERRESTYYPGEDGYRCEQVATISFRANSSLVFLNAGGAHGADIPATAPATTERYAYQFYVRRRWTDGPEPRPVSDSRQ